jgi:hypothetical protein
LRAPDFSINHLIGNAQGHQAPILRHGIRTALAMNHAALIVEGGGPLEQKPLGA